jgi:NAD(P)-dependent dehydrogenase (short-subunit alcohol dehydrogenase family)
MELAGKAALVTGGAVRIGRGICEALAEHGCRVAIHCRESRAEAEELTSRLEANGRAAVVVQGDLGSESACRKVLEDAWAGTEGLDILVNNAAVFHKDGLQDATEAALQAEFSVNAFAPIYLARCFAERVAERRGQGRIVNLLDRRIAGNEAGCLPYLLSKKMLAAFTQAAAVELAPAITVNGVAPGAILPPPGKGDDTVQDLAGSNPLNRQCTVDDVAEAVRFLLTADAVTGQILFVDGGQYLGQSTVDARTVSRS